VFALDTVRAAEPGEPVPLHHAAEALALRDPDHVDPITRGEDLGRHLLTGGVVRRVVGSELDQVSHRLGAGLVEVALAGAVDVAGSHLPVRELDGVVAVRVARANLRDDARPGLQHRDRDRARLGEDLGHPQLLADDPFDVSHRGPLRA
jgi:hypothetical protein